MEERVRREGGSKEMNQRKEKSRDIKSYEKREKRGGEKERGRDVEWMGENEDQWRSCKCSLTQTALNRR